MRIFCEGEDDKRFIIKILQHLKENGKITSKPEYGQYIFPTDGKSLLLKTNSYTKESKLIGKTIKKVLFIFDADFEQNDAKIGGMDKSIKAINNLTKGLNWNIPTDYYIFKNNLDDFIIGTLDKKQCFKEFDQCLDITDRNRNKKISTCIYRKLYPQAPYDFKHSDFDELKQKLTVLFQ